MRMKKNVLIIAQECNPNWVSVPKVCFQIIQALSNNENITLITHKRNELHLKSVSNRIKVEYIKDSWFSQLAHKIALKLSFQKKFWPIYHFLSLPIHFNFCKQVEKKYCEKILKKEYDVVHMISPMIPRYHAPLINLCHQENIPFILGPVNGGLEYPKGFFKISASDGGFFKKLIWIYQNNKLLKETYNKATKVICGGEHVINHLSNYYPFLKKKSFWMPENGILQDEIVSKTKVINLNKELKLIFIGRLVPYKGCQYVLKALGDIVKEYDNWNIKIIGDGEQYKQLQNDVIKYKIENKVKFFNWLEHHEVLRLLEDSDLLVFPSIREFGGGVIMEALSKGCPSVVANYGGPAEIVDEQTGYLVSFDSEDTLIQNLKETMRNILNNPMQLVSKSANSLKKADLFTWEKKADLISDLYNHCLTKRA